MRSPTRNERNTHEWSKMQPERFVSAAFAQLGISTLGTYLFKDPTVNESKVSDRTPLATTNCLRLPLTSCHTGQNTSEQRLPSTTLRFLVCPALYIHDSPHRFGCRAGLVSRAPHEAESFCLTSLRPALDCGDDWVHAHRAASVRSNR